MTADSPYRNAIIFIAIFLAVVLVLSSMRYIGAASASAITERTAP